MKREKKNPGKSTKARKQAAPAPRPAPLGAGASAVTVPVDTKLYPLDAVYGAAYIFLDRAYVLLEKSGEGTVKVTLTGKAPLTGKELEALGGEFANELLNQAIRAGLSESGRKIREYIVVKGLYGGAPEKLDLEQLLDQTLKETFDDDPLDIAVPWEEKYEKKDEEREDKKGKGGKK